MKEKKNIDRIFQERFKDFEAPAPSGAWENIESQLDENDAPVVLPLWWKIAGVAAVVLFIFSAVLWNSDDTIASENFVVEEPKEDDGIKVNPVDRAIPNSDAIVAGEPDNTIADQAENKTTDSKKGTRSTRTKANDRNDRLTTNRKKSDVEDAIYPSRTDFTTTNPSTTRDKENNDPTTNSSSNPSLIQEGLASSQSTKPTNAGKETHTPQDAIAGVSEKNDSPETINTSETSLEDIAAAGKEAATKLPEEDLFKKNWSASTMVAPVYANTMGGSSINSQVSDNSKNAEVNLSYGVAVAYEFAPRWSVRTGVNQVSMNYNTQDISYGLNAQTLTVNNTTAAVMYNPDAVNNQSTSAFNDSFSQELVSAATFSSFKGELSQQLGYLEVPLEIKYRLVDSKLGVSVLGGMSALFLTDNEVAVTNDGRKLSLGEDNNFQEFNQSANFGLGIDYRFTNKLGITVEPTFKYQLNALRNDSADFRPYTVGVYTGLMYRF
ncbi:outer membrane beta-barrel protein [Nonlabens marinus]|uniref:Outer membrane protein beta-barrel domain-containing protein n=1 Tax=Nonlabens marinus S1-08 TaxID=1454201 RepID=W8VUP4_9FLAO|nr:outer membrane beta-barrel protein [Nonlabens marinus]BAO54763.1 hypothetical protein NMS_0754 [Nonlabens marinus S1-08]